MKSIIITAAIILLAASAYASTFYRCQVDGRTIISNSPCTGQQTISQSPESKGRGSKPMSEVERKSMESFIQSSKEIRQQRARLSALPDYDTRAYCKRIGAVAGGSYRIEESCLNGEREARKELSRTELPEQIMKYCTRIGEVAGGSYKYMASCVKTETEAMSRIR